mmetsp:Transcript_853/g.737  ORF Transcript_853/g.737 Transcript_853/m.737 type:complete len:80 (+) Transcript_853:131-370(+)
MTINKSSYIIYTIINDNLNRFISIACFIIYRCMEVIILYMIGFYLTLHTNNVYIGCAILGISQGRAGWLMHEGGHHYQY